MNHLIQRGTKWEFAFTLWRVWDQALKGRDYSGVRVEFKVSHHLASSLPFPGGQWSMSSKAPWLWSHGSLCLECPSSPLLPGKQIHLSRPSSSTTSSKKPYHSLSLPPTHPCRLDHVVLLSHYSLHKSVFQNPWHFMLVFIFMPLSSIKLSAFSD